MNKLGDKIAGKRKALGMTQTEFAEKMCVTRQTVSRWESGSVLPDIDKIGDIAALLGVSCDYLLKDDISEEEDPVGRKPSRLLQSLTGKKVSFSFFDGETDIDLYDAVCTVLDYEGAWMRISADLKKGHIEKLIPLSSVQAIKVISEDT